MKNSIGVSNGTMIQGFIEIEKISTKDNVKTHYKNTITNGGKQFLLAKSAAQMITMSPSVFGDVVCSNMISVVAGNSYNSLLARKAAKNRDINNVLLNLSDDVLNSLGASTSFVNIWDETMSNADKVVGYASSDLNPTKDGKEGLIDYCLGEYMVDPYTVAKRWKYPEGVATGTINCIAMMPGTVLNDNSGDGVKFSKCIDHINTQYTNYANMSTGFLIPGIPGYTSNNEVLLNFKKDNVSRWKYNIGTGEISQVPDNEPFFIPTMGSYIITDMQYIDGYLYVVGLNSMEGSNNIIQVYVYDVANSMTRVSNFNIGSATSNEYRIKASIFKVGSDLYISEVNSTYSANYNPYKLHKLTIGSSGYATGVSNNYTDFSSLFTLPEGLNKNYVGIGKYGDNYILYNYIRVYNNLTDSKSYINGEYTGRKCVGYVFTDISNPVGTIIDMIPGVTPNEILFANTSVKGTLRVGYDKYNNGANTYLAYDTAQGKTMVMNNLSKSNNGSNSTTITVNTVEVGVYLTLDKWWTNIMSLVKLTTPIEKTDTDIIYVSYGYKIV